MNTLNIIEIYKSVQGESSWAGLPCTFIRLSRCPLRCSWCDTEYSYKKGLDMSVEEILDKVHNLQVRCVEITGGEPLSQKNTLSLMDQLIAKKYQVLLETSGAISLEGVPTKTHIIMDLKCPDSQMSHKNLYTNLNFLKSSDEIKFVVASQNDLTWAKKTIETHDLTNRFRVLLSPAWGLIEPKTIVDFMLEHKIDCRLNLQIHKYIWDPQMKGV